MYKHHNITPLGSKSGRAQYGEGQKGGEDKKDKRVGKNRKGERGGGDYRENKVNLMIRESSSFKATVYHHIIYCCYQGLMVLG